MSDLQVELGPQTDVEALEVENQLRRHLVRVYALMGGGLLITALVACYIARDPSMSEYIRVNPLGFQVLFLLEMVVVAFISKAVDKLSLGATAGLFFGLAIFNGFSFAVFFAWIPPSSIALGFAVTAATFGAMSLYGYNTQRDLGSLRSFCVMVVVGVAMLTLVNLAFGNSVAFWATPYLGVMAFSGLVAYHAQDLRDLEFEFEDDDADRCKAMYASALTLYLDFVNIYLLIMRAATSFRNEREE